MNDEQLAAMKRVTFLLASAKFFILEDQEAIRIADEAIEEAGAIIKEAEHEQRRQA